MLGALKAVFCLMCVFAAEMVEDAAQKPPPPMHQKIQSVSANVGQSIILDCFYDDNVVSKLFWYKQTLGEKPTVLTSFNCKNKDVKFHGQYENNWRFLSFSGKGVNRLTIIDLESSDSATYYCARNNASTVEFAEGTTVLVQDPGEGFPVWVQQWASPSNQSSDSVTLQCRVESGSCAGGAQVYWLRESREAEAAVFSTAGGSQQQCAWNDDAQTHSCLYTLTRSLDASHTGIYYCAVATCGRLLFGDGTKLDFGYSPSLVIFLGAALAFTSVLSLSLASFLCVMHRRSKSPAPFTTNQENGGNQRDVQYAALHIKKDRRPTRRGEEAEPECVYSGVRQ